MSEVVVVALFTTKEGSEQKAEALVRTIIAPTHAEDGCITFALHQDLDDPRRLVLVERWTSREALDRHLGSGHLATFRAAAPEVMAGPAQIHVMEALPEGDAAKGRLASS